MDFDLEEPEYENATAVANEVGAAQILQQDNSGLYISITMPGTTSGTGWFGQQVLDQASNNGARLRAKLAAQKLRLPILGNDDDTANRAYIKNIVLDYDSHYQRGVPSDKELGRKYGLEWAEAFHYIGIAQSRLDQYVKDNAIPL